MKNYKMLLPGVPKYFKANLHTHTTISDGTLTPIETKEAYKALGYQILAITDHNIIADYSNLNDADFLMLTAIEINVNANDCTKLGGKTYHLNLIAKDADNLWSPTKIYGRFPNAQEYEAKMQCENMELECNPESINTMIQKANEKGFLVTYNHPTWSCQSYPDYATLKGLWGVEIRNTECCMLGHNENNISVFNDILKFGNKIFPLGADDMHFARAIGKSWIMVGAEKLDYKCVIDALENGNFYMSCGPVINDLHVENGILKISCSDAKQINLESHVRFANLVIADNENLINEAKFDLNYFINETKDDASSFIRLTITAPDGTYAVTRAYYVSELI